MALKPLNIAMVAACPFPTSQGSQVLIRELAEALCKRGHRIHIVTYHFGEYPLEAKYKIHRIPKVGTYFRLEAGPSLAKFYLNLLLILKLNEMVKKERIDIIHAHNYEGLLVGYIVKRLKKIPLVYHSHNVLEEELPTYYKKKVLKNIAKLAGHLLDLLLPPRSDFCLAISESAASFLKGLGVSENRLIYLPPGIFTEEFPNGGSPVEQEVIIYAGNLDNYQNIDLLFKSFKKVVKSFPQAVLKVVSNSGLARYRQLGEKLGISHNLLFIRPKSFAEVKQTLAQSNIAVCPRTLRFGFPIKLLNYMASGRGIVVSEGSAK